jgi:HEAT repeat protein
MINANVDDPYLVAPLIDSLLTDPSDAVRFEAIRLLARRFEDDARARSAFELVATRDLSPEVRTQARWQLLDENGRFNYVTATVMNTDLPDSERLALLTARVTGLARSFDRRSVMALADISARAGSSSQQSAPGADDGSVDASLVIPLLIEILEDDPRPEVRASAASALARHIDETGVRAALERAMRADTSETVRRQIGFGLQRAQFERLAR